MDIDIDALIREKEAIPAQIKQARRDADLSRIRELRARDVELDDIIIVERMNAARALIQTKVEALRAIETKLSPAREALNSTHAEAISSRRTADAAEDAHRMALGTVQSIELQITEAREAVRIAENSLSELETEPETETEERQRRTSDYAAFAMSGEQQYAIFPEGPKRA